jgi:hypothetical protein
MFSGGIGSWMAAKRVAGAHRTQDMTLLFTDTRMEDADLYRFIREAADDVGVPLTTISEGRTPWQVFFDERFLGNSHHDPCSRILKREFADKWLLENCDPNDTVVYVGIDWSEIHRYTRLQKLRAAQGWRYEAPLCDPPYLDKQQMIDILEIVSGIAAPRLYAMGFSHNNCGGFCIKAGHGHFANLLVRIPERYAEHEQKEQDIRIILGDVSIMSDRRGDNKKKPFTLLDLRRRIEAGSPIDNDEIGGCGCFTGD